MSILVGVDIGTQGTKTALYGEDGKLLTEAFVASKPHTPAPGVVEENPEDQFEAVLETLRQCMAVATVDPSLIAGIAIVGQMAGVIGVDAQGWAVTHYDSWLDTRCSGQIELMQRKAGEEVLAKTGHAPSINHGPKKLWWKQERPADYARIHAFVQPGGYAAMRLCGLSGHQAFIDRTYLHFSGFADNCRGKWDADLCRRFELDETKLPQVVDSATIVGTVRADWAKQCGIPVDVPVIAGCGDTAASFLACGATEPGICVDVAGTAAVFGATTDTFVADSMSRTLGCGQSVIRGNWHPYAYINGGGQNLEWFRRQITAGAMNFAALSESAAMGSNGDVDLPYFVPHLGGRVSPSAPQLRGSWAGLHWNVSSGDLFRSALEGVALEYAHYRTILTELLPDWSMKEIRITGGGEKSAVWNQLKADRLQVKVQCIARSGGAPMGAALLAGHGVGVFPDLVATASRWVEKGLVYEADATVADLSISRIQKYRSLVDALLKWSG